MYCCVVWFHWINNPRNIILEVTHIASEKTFVFVRTFDAGVGFLEVHNYNRNLNHNPPDRKMLHVRGEYTQYLHLITAYNVPLHAPAVKIAIPFIMFLTSCNKHYSAPSIFQ